MPTTIDLSPEEIAQYRKTAEKRRRKEKSAMQQRRTKALAVARRAAQLLRSEFNATKVVVFGSLARGSGFTRWSDVDLAVWGLAPEDTFKAIGTVMDLDPEINVNLVDINTATTSLKKVVEQDGVPV